MKIAIAGGTGFIGSRLIDSHLKKGAQIVVISRTKQPQRDSRITAVTWQELENSVAPLEGADAIINLAGETINQTWNAASKSRIHRSRIEATERVAQIVSRMTQKPRVVVNGSATNFAEQRDENTVEFLADVVRDWEQAADRIQGVRVVKLRTGVVLDRHTGALPLMLLPYKLFAGGKVGSGKQWFPWIHIDDIVGLIEFCIENDAVEGPVNAAAPEAATNDQFGRAVGRAMHRPHWFPVPGFLLRLFFGERADLMLKGQKVLPEQALRYGYEFRYPTLKKALADLLRA